MLDALTDGCPADGGMLVGTAASGVEDGCGFLGSTFVGDNLFLIAVIKLMMTLVYYIYYGQQSVEFNSNHRFAAALIQISFFHVFFFWLQDVVAVTME